MSGLRLISTACSVLLLLSACGGAGGGGDAPTSATYTIGGTITGLTGSVTLQNNGGDSLTLIANGAFSFSTKVSAGSAYAVKVTVQPEVPDCVVNKGSGNATANVTDISIVCAISPATRFIPLRAERPGSVYCDIICAYYIEGLYVVSTKNVEHAPVQVTAEAIDAIAVVPEHTVSAGATVTGARPAALVYRTNSSGADGDYLWVVDLSGGSNLVPRRLGALKVRSVFEGSPAIVPALCDTKLILQKLDDPESAFLIVRLGDDAEGPCSGNLRSVMIRLSDSPTTEPLPVPVGAGNLQPLYRPDATLAGIVGFDPNGQGVVFFSDATFATSHPLFRTPVLFDSLRDGQYVASSGSTWTDLMGSQTFAIIATDDGNYGRTLYRIDYDGSSHLLYDLSEAWDTPSRIGANVYVQDLVATNPDVLRLMRIPVNGSAPQSWMTNGPDANCYAVDAVAGVIGQNLIVWRTCWVGTQLTASHVLSLSGPTSGAVMPIASYPGELANVSVAQDRVLVSFISESALSTPLTPLQDYATAVLDSAGSVVLPKAPGAFLSFHGDPSDTLLQVRDVTGPGLQNGVLYKLALGSPAAPSVSRLEYPDTSPALVPMDAFGLNSTAIAPGLVYCTFVDQTTFNYAAIVDVARGRVVKINPSGVNLHLIRVVQ
jgi:hypothetical protein